MITTFPLIPHFIKANDYNFFIIHTFTNKLHYFYSFHEFHRQKNHFHHFQESGLATAVAQRPELETIRGC